MLNFTDSPLFISFVQQVANLWDHNYLLKDAKIVIFRIRTNEQITGYHLILSLWKDQSSMAYGVSVALNLKV